MNRSRLIALWCAAVLVAGIAALALALVLGRGAPPPAPPGLDDNGRLAAWLGEIASYLGIILGVTTVGLSLVASGVLDHPWQHTHAVAAAVAALWSAFTLLEIGLLGWELNGRVELFDSTRAQALLVELILVVVAAAALNVSSGSFGALVGMVASLAALLPVVLVGHPRSADDPLLAGVSVSVHVVSSAMWVGGLVALGMLAAQGREWSTALHRYSQIALACVIALILSGVVNAAGRLTTLSQLFTTRYGAVVLLKIVLLCGLVAAGWVQRRYVVGRASLTRRRFLPVVATELTIMMLALALASALSRTPPPA